MSYKIGPNTNRIGWCRLALQSKWKVEELDGQTIEFTPNERDSPSAGVLPL